MSGAIYSLLCDLNSDLQIGTSYDGSPLGSRSFINPLCLKPPQSMFCWFCMDSLPT